jgi:hypothetical protein
MTNDEENTWRALQDNDKIIPMKCNWGFHRYTVWATDLEAKLPLSATIKEIRLVRMCADCHIPKYKIIRKPLI